MGELDGLFFEAYATACALQQCLSSEIPPPFSATSHVSYDALKLSDQHTSTSISADRPNSNIIRELHHTLSRKEVPFLIAGPAMHIRGPMRL